MVLVTLQRVPESRYAAVSAKLPKTLMSWMFPVQMCSHVEPWVRSTTLLYQLE